MARPQTARTQRASVIGRTIATPLILTALLIVFALVAWVWRRSFRMGKVV